MTNFEALDLKEESDVPEPAVRIMSKVENLNDTVDQCTFMETSKFSLLKLIYVGDLCVLELDSWLIRGNMCYFRF